MKRIVLLALASLIGSAPESLAQMPAQRLSADGSCPLPAQQVAKPNSAASAVTTPKQRSTQAASGCVQCDSHYHVPSRWHRFLPGMFR